MADVPAPHGLTMDEARTGRLLARPIPPRIRSEEKGTLLLSLDERAPPLLYVPPAADPDRPAPLVVMLHGAGGRAQAMIELLRPHADREGFLVLAPQSRGPSWDVIHSEFGPDVLRLDEALRRTFAGNRVDPTRVAVAGFSDGASYALSLGLANGDLFTHVLAFSPGFVAQALPRGAPRIFISHGDADRVLPVERCARRIVQALARLGYDARYLEFEGGHAVPEDIATDAFSWFVSGRAL